MQGSYVVPKATRGGAQVNPAAFKKAGPAPYQQAQQLPQQPPVQSPVPQAPVVQQPVPQPPPPQLQPQPQQQMPPMPTQSLASQFEQPPAPSLMQQFNRPMSAETFKPMRIVTFEMRGPMGRFQVRYHDVIRSGINLVLIYDHANPTQMVWFPELHESAADEPPVMLAALVHSNGEEPEMLYMVHPTPVNYRYDNKQHCVLLIEHSKQMSNIQGE